MANINGKKLMECLKNANEPMTFDDLAIALDLPRLRSRDKTASMDKLRTVLKAAVRLGFVQEFNDHFIAATHVEDIADVLKLKDGNLDETSSQIFYED